MVQFAYVTDNLQLAESALQHHITAEQVSIHALQLGKAFLIHFIVDGKVVEHEYDIHSAFVVSRLLLPSYQQREHTGKAEIIVCLDIVIIIIVQRSDAVDDVNQLANI